MAKIGYARVSSPSQDNAIQVEQLKAAGCHPIFEEKKSGTDTGNRPELAQCLRYLREGDVLMVTRLDRLARSMADFFKIMAILKEKDAMIRVIHQPEIDTTTPNGRLITNIFAALAEYENELRRERQREGIEKAKTKGTYSRSAVMNGRKARASYLLKSTTLLVEEIARQAGVSKKSLYNWFPEELRARRDRLALLGPEPAPHPPSAAEAVGPDATPETSVRKPGFLGGFRRA